VTLQNLLRIGKLKEHIPTPEEVQRLLAAVERNLADTEVEAISDETRFDVAYKAVMQCSMVAMMAAGYRPATSEPGHHQTMIQSLPLTMGTDNEVWVVLDALRRPRNANDYTGQPITLAATEACIAQARALRSQLLKRLKAQHPDLLKKA
jgi:hypothetical protein